MSLNHFCAWGCPVEVKIYNPSKIKLNPKTAHCYFISYPNNSKMYKFYFLSRSTKVVDSITTKFLENDASECSYSRVRYVNLKEEIVIMPILVVQERVVFQPNEIEEVSQQKDVPV